MADTTIQRIIEIHTKGGVDSVKSLKKEINDLKDALLNVEKGTEDYDKGVKLLQEDQKRLNEVTALTKQQNTALETSYYDLNNQLVQARKDYKNLTAEQRENAEVGGVLLAKIGQLDTQLKQMDASMGQYQRNVGGYGHIIEEFGGTISQLPPGLGHTAEKVKNLGQAMKLVSKNPLIAIIGIVAPLLGLIADKLKTNDKALGSVNKAMASLKPVTEVLGKVMDYIADALSRVVDWFSEMMKTAAPTLQKIATIATGVGNVIFKALVTPIKAAIEAVKGFGKIIGDVIHGDFAAIKDDAKAAGQAIKDAFVEGYNIKANFDTGKAAGEEFVKGIKSTTPAVKEVAEEQAEEVKKTWMSALEYRKLILGQQIALEQQYSDEWIDLKKQQRELEHEEEIARLNDTIEDEAQRAEAIRLAELNLQKDLQAIDDAAYNAQVQAYQKAEDEKVKAAQQAAKKELDIAKERAAAQARLEKAKRQTILNSLSTIMSLYEAFGGEQAKQSEGYKMAASAEALVQTYLAANEAYAAMASIPGVGPALGIAAAAAAVASGLANVRQINATSMTSSNASPSVSVPTATASRAQTAAVAQAPAVIQQVQTTRTLTGAAEEERMNNAQRVYLVYSDVQQAGRKVAVQQSEATF